MATGIFMPQNAFAENEDKDIFVSSPFEKNPNEEQDLSEEEVK